MRQRTFSVEVGPSNLIRLFLLLQRTPTRLTTYAALFITSSAGAQTPAADLIVTNARVYTVDLTGTTAYDDIIARVAASPDRPGARGVGLGSSLQRPAWRSTR